MDFSNLKVAVLHYWLTSYRGGERVVKQILKLFPQADIYTLFADPQICREHFAGHKIYSSFLDKPILRRYYKNLFPLYPMGVEKIKLQQKYDLIISSESGPIKGIPNPHGIPHICYIHTPMRYCWGYTEDYLQSIPEPLKYAVAHMFRKLRRWDYTTRDAPDLYIANSKNVRTRVKQYYHKEAEVIYPPVSAYLFDEPLEAQKEKYYLYLGAVTPYKGVNMMIEAFNITRKPLVIASDRAGLNKLKSSVNPEHIRLVTALSEENKIRLYKSARALIFPADEDFGIVPLEAMACGTPVIALGRGGALETVIENPDEVSESTGIFFKDKSARAINLAIQQFEKVEDQFSPEFLRMHAAKFHDDVFLNNMEKTIRRFLENCTR